MQDAQQKDLKLHDEDVSVMKVTSEKYGTPLEKWTPIEMDAQALRLSKKAVKKGSEVDRVLTETENALKFGLFCMTLMYFRGLSMLKKQKQVWSISAQNKNELGPSKEQLKLQKERLKQDQRQK